jgi:hypothetical protein
VSIAAVRNFLAWACVWLAFIAFAGYAAYGFYLDQKLARFWTFEPPPKAQRWNPSYYAPGAERWLARDRRWHRWRNAVWLGAIAFGNGLYLLLKP